jgi:hypothetical protein
MDDVQFLERIVNLYGDIRYTRLHMGKMHLIRSLLDCEDRGNTSQKCLIVMM